MRKLAEIEAEFYRAYLGVVGPYVQIVELADDLGSQAGPLISPRVYRELLRDKHAYLVRTIKQAAPQAKVMLHSCGSVRAFIPDFIAAGIEILNPVQPLAKGMEPAKLKAEFGSEIAFLGGVDVQQTMRGPVEGVRDEVRRRIDELGQGRRVSSLRLRTTSAMMCRWRISWHSSRPRTDTAPTPAEERGRCPRSELRCRIPWDCTRVLRRSSSKPQNDTRARSGLHARSDRPMQKAFSRCWGSAPAQGRS